MTSSCTCIRNGTARIGRPAAGVWTKRKTSVDSLFETVDETVRYIAERKAMLEEMLGANGSQGRVTAYRAGAFTAQPGNNLLAALSKTGFCLDSSVVHGTAEPAYEFSQLDYRHAPRNRTMWRVEDDVAIEDNPGLLWEIPIASRPGRRFQQATIRRLRAKFSKNVPKEQQGRMVKSLGLKANPLKAMRFLCSKVPVKFDFHNVSPGKLIEWIRKVPKPTNGEPDVVVLIGHTKEHIDDAAFDRLLSMLTAAPDLRVTSFTEIARQLERISPPPHTDGSKLASPDRIELSSPSNP